MADDKSTSESTASAAAFRGASESPAVKRWRKRFRHHGVLAIAGAAMLLMLMVPEARRTNTADEFGHLVRGLAWWSAPDTRLSWPHPPLSHVAVTAWPALAGDDPAFEKMKSFSQGDFRRVTRAFVLRDFALAREHLRLARGFMALLALATLMHLHRWCRRTWDLRTANFVTVLFASNTLLLAHAGVVTTDFPVAAAATFAFTSAHDHLERFTWRSRCVLGIAFGVLAAVKLSGVGIAVLLGLYVAIATLFGRGMAAHTWSRRVATFALDAGCFVLLTLFVVNAAYRFDETMLTVGEVLAHPTPVRKHHDLLRMTPLAALPPSLRVPVPWTYLYSAAFIQDMASGAGQGGLVVDGQLQPAAPGYFVRLLGMKLPLGALALFVAGAIQRPAWRQPALRMAFFVVAALLAITFRSRINLGVRHVLAVVPLVLIVAGFAAAALTRLRSTLWGIVGAYGAAASCVVGAALAYPWFIGDFNWLAGGRARGHEVSIVAEDWGQDLSLLADFINETDPPRRVAYSTTYSFRVPELVHLGAKVIPRDCRRPFPKKVWIAVHASDLALGRCLDALPRREPSLVLNDHILLYAP